MFYKAGDPRRRLPTGLIFGSATIAASLWTLNSCFGGGNEHGASHTDLDTMPSYGVEQEVPAESQQEKRDKAAKSASRLVCRGIFVDTSNENNYEIIVNPIVDPSSKRPLELTDITPSGPDFMAALPRDNFEVYESDGKPANSGLLEDCVYFKPDVRSVENTANSDNMRVLVNPESTIQSGESLTFTVPGAVDKELIHQRLYLTAGQFPDSLNQLR